MARRSEKEPIKKSISVGDALRRKHGDLQLVEQDIGSEDFGLRVEKGAKLSAEGLARYIKVSREWAQRKVNLDARNSRQDARNREIKQITADHHPGLRGLYDYVRNRVVRVDTDIKIQYSRQGLKDALGGRYPSVVTETGVFKVDGMTPERARMIFMAGFAAVHMTEEDYEQHVTEDVELEVNEKKLYGLIKADKVDPMGIGEATMTYSLQSDEYTGDRSASPVGNGAKAGDETQLRSPLAINGR